MALWDSLRGPLEGLGSPLEGHIRNASKDTQANYQHLPEYLLKHFLCGAVVVLLLVVVVVVVVVVHVGPYRSSGGSWGVLGRSLEVAGGSPGGVRGSPGGPWASLGGLGGSLGGSPGGPGGSLGGPRGGSENT